MRETARQSRLCNVAVYAAADAAYWEGMRIMPGPIARRANHAGSDRPKSENYARKMSCRTKVSSD